jgi:hypothetical protein
MNVGVITLAGFALGFALCVWVSQPPAPVSCYEIVSIRPEQHAVVLFNACTGDVEVRFLAVPPSSQPAPAAPNADSF